MDETTREVTTWILGTSISVVALIGLATKFVLLPYLKEHLVRPMKLVEKQVSENHHSNVNPTVLDRIDDVQTQVEMAAQQVQELRSEMKAMATMYEGHLVWSDRWVELIERELDFIKQLNIDNTKKPD